MQMNVLDTSGHKTHKWDMTNPEEARAAREVFEELQRQGYRAFRDDGKSTDGLIDRLDKTAEKVLMVPAIVGG